MRWTSHEDTFSRCADRSWIAVPLELLAEAQTDEAREAARNVARDRLEGLSELLDDIYRLMDELEEAIDGF